MFCKYFFLTSFLYKKTGFTMEEDGGEIGGSGVNFPLHLGETPTQSTEEQSEQPTVPQCL